MDGYRIEAEVAETQLGQIMNKNQVRDAVANSIAELKQESPALNFADVHERSTAHRLAVHFEKYFGLWNIDCEYDRLGFLTKNLEGISECSEQKKTDRILPDIIVHRRQESGTNSNLLVVELKKSQ